MFLSNRQYEVLSYLKRHRKARIKSSEYMGHVTWWLFGAGPGKQVDGRTARGLRIRKLVVPVKDLLGVCEDTYAISPRGQILHDLEKCVRRPEPKYVVEEAAA